MRRIHASSSATRTCGAILRTKGTVEWSKSARIQGSPLGYAHGGKFARSRRSAATRERFRSVFGLETGDETVAPCDLQPICDLTGGHHQQAQHREREAACASDQRHEHTLRASRPEQAVKRVVAAVGDA